MELFDWVDKDDNVIGVTNKKEAHELGHIHRVAAVYVFDHDGKLLVQLRKKDGLFDHSVGGHLGVGENYFDGAKREMFEEVGLKNEIIEVGTFYSDEISSIRNQNILHYFGVYETHIDKDTRLTTAPEEVENIIPMTIEEIAEGMIKEPEKFTLGFMKTLKFYTDKRNIKIPDIKLI